MWGKLPKAADQAILDAKIQKADQAKAKKAAAIAAAGIAPLGAPDDESEEGSEGGAAAAQASEDDVDDEVLFEAEKTLDEALAVRQGMHACTHNTNA